MVSDPHYKNYYTLKELKEKIKEIENYIVSKTGCEFKWDYMLGEGVSYVMEYYMLLKERYYHRLKMIKKRNKKNNIINRINTETFKYFLLSYAIKMVGDTVQVNFRWPITLLKDLEFVAKNLKVQKGDWVRMTLSKKLSEERDNLEAHITRRFIKGYITEKEYTEKMGRNPGKELKDIRKRNLENSPTSKQNLKATRKYLLESIGLNPENIKETFEEPTFYFACPNCYKESEIPLTKKFFEEITKKKRITCPECKLRFEVKK